MNTVEMSAITKLDYEHKEKISYFATILLRKSKYKKMKEEIAQARLQISNSDTLSHNDTWNSVNV